MYVLVYDGENPIFEGHLGDGGSWVPEKGTGTVRWVIPEPKAEPKAAKAEPKAEKAKK